jgi:hypothetical protein
VGHALSDLGDLAGRSLNGDEPRRSVAELLEEQQQCYVMESQKIVHARFSPGGGHAASAAPKIELF